METTAIPRLIHVTRLRTGMTVWIRKEKDGIVTFTRDCILGKYYLTSVKRPTISFEQKGGGAIVIWHPCGKVWASYEN